MFKPKQHCLVVLFTMIIVRAHSAETIDCNAIDKEKFKELFEFKYGGGSRGLKMKFDFVSESSNQFIVNECKFLLKEMKYSEKKNYKKTKTKSLNSLQPCTKYNIILTVQNVATKKEFAYENFVTTRPADEAKIKLSVVEVNSSLAAFDWTVSPNGCYVKYQLTLKNDTKEVVYDNVVTKRMRIEDLSPSHAYSAVLTAHDDKGSKRLSQIENFKTLEDSNDNKVNDYDINLNIFKLGSDYVELTWNISSVDKTLKYHVEVFDAKENQIFNEKLANLSASIHNLKGCSNYMARISIVGASKIASLPFKTLSAMPSDIRNLILNSSHNTSTPMISWDAPEFYSECVTGYLIKYKNTSANATWISNTIERDKTNIELIPQEYGLRISLNICPRWLSEKNVQECAGETFNTRTLENVDMNKVLVETVREFRLSATEVQLRWDFYSAYDSILKHFQVIYEDEVILTNKTLVNLKTAACKRNYTVVIRCETFAGSVGPNVTYHLNLNDNDLQLSPIAKISVEERNKSLLVSWTPDEAESSCISYYEIDFRSQHFKTVEPKTEINDFQACMPYQIHITPVSEVNKRGGTTIYEFTTQVIVPKAPSKPFLIKNSNNELQIASTISDDDTNCVMMAPTVMEFSCSGFKAVENITVIQKQYIGIVKDLKPNTKYNCFARLRNDVGVSKESEISELSTQEDAPQPPKDVNSQLNNDNTVDINWTADNSTGNPNYYKVLLTLNKMHFPLGDGCHRGFKNKTIHEATEEKLKLKNLVSFSEYSVRVIASNNHGNSEVSKEIIFTTLPSSPSVPRDVSVTFEIHENSSISGLLAWKPPCMMNGKFNLYTISLRGRRKGIDDHRNIEATQIEEIELKDLRMGFNYEVEIQAVNQQHSNKSGEVKKFSFVAPSGIPLEKDLEDWTLLGSHPDRIDPEHVEIFMKRRIFISNIGDITGVAFLLFLANCPDLPQPSHGYISTTNLTLPSTQTYMNCSQLYQQTDILQNPLVHDNEIDSKDLDKYNVKFIIGEEKCSRFPLSRNLCNGPLQIGESYGLTARIFTSDGFRDTKPVFFETRQILLSHISPFLVTIIAIVCLIILSLFLTLCCWISLKRQKKQKKKKEAAETVENLLSFTSYCVIDKNPLPRNAYDDVL